MNDKIEEKVSQYAEELELQLRMAIARLAEGRASIYTLNREEPVGGLEIEEVLNVWQKFRHDHNVRSI